jgi:thymidine phosphorylase
MTDTPFLPQEVIRAKRDGRLLTAEEIASFIAGITDGSITEGQIAAFAMAIYFQSLAPEESVALTRAMTASGPTLRWPELDRPILDKHSTGGVGDKVSLVLAPILAACGAAVPMISGRGLGHTGGTLDKLDAIPGYRTTPDIETFQAVARAVGCAIVGQTAELAPADRRFYGVRDVTATVESVPLITASILSKKLAAGLDGLVMDVKVGNGAFMTNVEEARTLAESIVTVAIGAGLPTRALITDMNQVLGKAAGNALEVAEAIDYLTGRMRHPRLHGVVMALASEMLTLGGLAEDEADATKRIERVLGLGAAAEAFGKMVAALGGPPDILDRTDDHLARAPGVLAVTPPHEGFVAALDTRAIGLAVIALGGGRVRADQAIDPTVGFSEIAGIGEPVGPGRPLALVHARNREEAEGAAETLRQAVIIEAEAAEPPPLIHACVSGPDHWSPGTP